MRRRDDKEFFEGSVELHALASGLNHIYKTVQKGGLTEEAMLSLSEDVSGVASHFGISPKGAILLGLITENNAMNGSDQDDLAGYVGCSNIEFIGFRAGAGPSSSSRARRQRASRTAAPSRPRAGQESP